MIRDYILKLERKNITMSILLLILAICLIWKPIGFIKTIVIVIGSLLLIEAIIDIITFVGAEKEEKALSWGLFKGIIEIIAGIFLIFRNEVLIDLFPVILGIIIIFNNVFKMQVAFNLKQVDTKKWIPEFTVSLLCILLGVVIVMNPFKTLETIIVVAGIIILISELFSVLYSVFVVRKINIIDEAIAEEKDDVKEAKFIEVKSKKVKK